MTTIRTLITVAITLLYSEPAAMAQPPDSTYWDGLQVIAIKGESIYFNTSEDRSDGVDVKVGSHFAIQKIVVTLYDTTNTTSGKGTPLEWHRVKVGEVVITEWRENVIVGRYSGQPLSTAQLKAERYVADTPKWTLERSFDSHRYPSAVPPSAPAPPPAPKEKTVRIMTGRFSKTSRECVPCAKLTLDEEYKLSDYIEGKQDERFSNRLSSGNSSGRLALSAGSVFYPVLNSAKRPVQPSQDTVMVLIPASGNYCVIYERDFRESIKATAAEEEAKELERKRRQEMVKEAEINSKQARTEIEKKAYNDGFWIDDSTKLMWAAKDNGNQVSYPTAETYCRELRLADFRGWRLATMDELEKLYDLSKSHDLAVMSMIVTQYHIAGGILLAYPAVWSSSANPKLVSVFSFGNGKRVPQPPGLSSGTALCVRAATDK